MKKFSKYQAEIKILRQVGVAKYPLKLFGKLQNANFTFENLHIEKCRCHLIGLKFEFKIIFGCTIINALLI